MYLRPEKQNVSELLHDLRLILRDLNNECKKNGIDPLQEKTMWYWEQVSNCGPNLTDHCRPIAEQFPEGLPIWIQEIAARSEAARRD